MEGKNKGNNDGNTHVVLHTISLPRDISFHSVKRTRGLVRTSGDLWALAADILVEKFEPANIASS